MTTKGTIILTAVVSTLLTLLLVQAGTWYYHSTVGSTQAVARLVKHSAKVLSSVEDRPDFRGIARRAVPAVVSINVYNPYGIRISSGSGVVVSGKGDIITNYHVVDDAFRLSVELADKRSFKAELLGADPSTDLALLRIEADDLTVVEFGDSDSVEIGEWVMAVGNPFNLTSTVTVGIVSAKGRSINVLNGAYAVESFIQTDAVVNPGNSGGALLSTQGKLVGINTAILSKEGKYEGYSFAVPANLVRKVYQDLRDHGRVQRAVLGVGIRELTQELAQRLGITTLMGVVVTRITKGSSAYSAGLAEGDIIVALDNQMTGSVAELQELTARYRPGDRVELTYIRQGQTLRQQVALAAIP